jgi:ceramide glucosyltransferase
VVAGEPAWPNAKVWSLERMVASARHPLLIISDSDVLVAPGYLQEVTAPLLDAQNGMVTCVYRGLPVGGLWSRLEALAMSVEFTSGVLVADMLEGMEFALGPTMAIRRECLEKIGGMAALADYCADDYVLGNRVAAAGWRVVLSREIIDHVVMNYGARESFAHQVRWMKSTRYSRPKGHLGSGLTFAVPFGIVAAVGGSVAGLPALGMGALAWCWVNRVLQSVVVGWGVVRDPRALAYAWLYPLRDLLGFFLWVASYLGSTIVWRNHRYRLSWGGKMVSLEAAPAAVQGSSTGPAGAASPPIVP